MPSASKSTSGVAWLTRRELAARFTVHPMTVTKWEQEGLPVARRGRRGKPSLYDEAACRAWHDARETAAADEGPVDLVRERARKERAQAMLAEQAYASRAKILLPADEVERLWTAELMAARAKLLSLPHAYADRLARAATRRGVAGAEDLIRQMVEEVLAELAEGPATDQPLKRRRRKTRTAA